MDTTITPTILTSASQWVDDVRRHAALGLGERARQVLLDTKHLALREVAIRRYLAAHRVRRLQLGAGSNLLPGWLNSDLSPSSRAVIHLDATRRFPFADGTFDRVFSEHQLEHLDHPAGEFMLREVFRVMRPGGRLRVVTPDLARLLGLYGGEQSDEGARYVRWITERFLPEAPRPSPVFVVNCCMRAWGHRFLHDRATLTEALLGAGFVDVEACEPGESRDRELRGIDSHGRYIGDEAMARFEAMTLEARRP